MELKEEEGLKPALTECGIKKRFEQKCVKAVKKSNLETK